MITKCEKLQNQLQCLICGQPEHHDQSFEIEKFLATTHEEISPYLLMDEFKLSRPSASKYLSKLWKLEILQRYYKAKRVYYRYIGPKK